MPTVNCRKLAGSFRRENICQNPLAEACRNLSSGRGLKELYSVGTIFVHSTAKSLTSCL